MGTGVRPTCLAGGAGHHAFGQPCRFGGCEAGSTLRCAAAGRVADECSSGAPER